MADTAWSPSESAKGLTDAMKNTNSNFMDFLR